MTRYDLSPLFRSTVGFDRFARLLDSLPDTVETVQSYPPYNIEADGEDRYRISVAVAGFTDEMLSIEVKEDLLTISGKSPEVEAETTYLHHGIAGRDFVRKFQLDDHVKVTGANLINGLLTIDLVREVPEEKKPRVIEIKKSSPQSLLGKAKKLLEGDPSKAA
ncbi:MAG: Hsp20 family protein [Rhodospirillales bacterium]|nr:Hsp20 family protein [Rhodospirillales bacterium]